MYAELSIQINGNTAYFNMTGTPKELAQALEHAAKARPELAEALDLLKFGIHGCKCGKLSQSECEMSCLAPPFIPIVKPTKEK